MKIDQDSWDDWLSHPITEQFMRALRAWATEQQDKWLEASWESGEANQMLLVRFKEREAVLKQMASVTPEQIEEANES